MGKTIFVTSGATVPFPDMIEAVLSRSFIAAAVENGYSRIIAQIGKGYTATLLERVAALKTADDYKCSLTAQELGCDSIAASFKMTEQPLEVVAIEFSSKIEHIITELADLVISHAGAGSILDSLRLGAPLMVCVNEKLMDNHQQQIADKFEGLGYIIACKANAESLVSGITAIQTADLKPFPSTHNIAFENSLVSVAYSL